MTIKEIKQSKNRSPEAEALKDEELDQASGGAEIEVSKHHENKSVESNPEADGFASAGGLGSTR